MSENRKRIEEILESRYENIWEFNLDKYNLALSLIKDGEDADIFRCWKLCELLEFTGSTNFDASDMLQVLKVFTKGVTTQDEIHELFGFAVEYISLMFCVLDAKELIEYGSSLRCCWITEKGKEALNPEYTLEFKKMIDPNMRFTADQIV